VIKKTTLVTLLVGFVAISVQHIAFGQADEHAQLANALGSAKISLQNGIATAEREGTPISAKFEVEGGKLQLSIYTMKGDKFSEVIIDHQTGRVAKTEPITEGEDLASAKQQAEAMGKAKSSLRVVTDSALKANGGFRAVSVVPTLKDGKPVAEVTVAKGGEFKTVTQHLN
jgi:hypothetical protein